jgi:acyl carrier protein
MSKKIEAELFDIFKELGLITQEGGPPADDIVLADLGADSLTVMDLCVVLEERYDFIVEPADVMKQATLSKLALFIAGRRPERA